MSLLANYKLLGVDEPTPARDITLIVGDSNANGFGNSIPVVPANALYNWNGTAFDPITTQSVSNGNPTKGSIWQKYASDYYNDVGTTVYLVNAALGGSDVCPTADLNDWSTTGLRYPAMQAMVAAAIADAPGSVVTTICINLMVNDVRAVATIANITTHWNSLLDRLHADFPTADILLINVGRIEAVAFNQLLVQVRDLVVDSAHARSYCNMITSGAFYVGVPGAYEADNLHYSQTTNDSMGVNFAKWRRYNIYPKWPRSIIAAHHTDIAVSFRNKIRDLIPALGDDFIKIPYLTPLWSDSPLNYLVDFTFRSYAVQGSGGLMQSANGWLNSNGAVANCMAAGYYTGLSLAGGGSQDNYNFLVRVGAIRTTPGVACALFGVVITGGSRLQLFQQAGASDVAYAASDMTLNVVTDDDILPNVAHSVGRSGGTKEYYQGSSLVGSAAVALLATVNSSVWIGCRNNVGTLDFPINADLGFVVAFPSSVDRANLVAAIEAYLL